MGPLSTEVSSNGRTAVSEAVNRGSNPCPSARSKSMNCLFCEEPLLHGEKVIPINDGRDQVHQECMMRQVVGSVGHQNGTCHCHGGNQEDPPGLTKREAAREAFALWKSRQPRIRLIEELWEQSSEETRCPHVSYDGEKCQCKITGTTDVCDTASLQLWCLDRERCTKCVFHPDKEAPMV
jgi:hypothetical protein